MGESDPIYTILVWNSKAHVLHVREGVYTVFIYSHSLAGKETNYSTLITIESSEDHNLI